MPKINTWYSWKLDETNMIQKKKNILNNIKMAMKKLLLTIFTEKTYLN
jgi:hypothetical protein